MAAQGEKRGAEGRGGGNTNSAIHSYYNGAESLKYNVDSWGRCGDKLPQELGQYSPQPHCTTVNKK